MKTLTKKMIKSLIKKRENSSGKGSHGHALIIAGRKGMMGTAIISSKACLRSGVGLITVNVPQDERIIPQSIVPEAILMMRENKDYNLNRFSAVGIGPGIGIDKAAEEMLINYIKKCDKPLLLDADALTIIALNKNILNIIPQKTILTPHHIEFDRLFGIHKNIESRMKTALQKAKEYNIVIVLKSHETLITSSDKIFLNKTGNAGLAKGGSGDALTGIITSFLAQGYKPINAAKQGVYLHGLASDFALKEQSMESMLISDVINCLGEAFKHISK